MSFKVPEQYRDLNYSTPADGNNGYFCIKALAPSDTLVIIASDGEGWEHVSVSKKSKTPTWEEMCKVKALFWGPDDCVIQYHPRQKDYVNNHPHCLHMWRPTNVEIPTPDPILVGVK